MLIRILTRDSYARAIEVECPHCTLAVSLSPQAIDGLEGGAAVMATCPQCGQPFDVTPEELVIDGSLQLIGLGDGQYMVAFAPSTGPTRGVPTQLDGVAALDAFLQTLG